MFVCRKSTVSNPSANQPYISANICQASCFFPALPQSAETHRRTQFQGLSRQPPSNLYRLNTLPATLHAKHSSLQTSFLGSREEQRDGACRRLPHEIPRRGQEDTDRVSRDLWHSAAASGALLQAAIQHS
jgi:hypothetical protein